METPVDTGKEKQKDAKQTKEYTAPEIRPPLPPEVIPPAHPDTGFSSHLHNDWTHAQTSSPYIDSLVNKNVVKEIENKNKESKILKNKSAAVTIHEIQEGKHKAPLADP